MIDYALPTRAHGGLSLPPSARRVQGRSVRLALVTWPAIALLGATFAAAACLLADCDCSVTARAKETLVGTASTVKSIAFRPDGAMLSRGGNRRLDRDLGHERSRPTRLPARSLRPGSLRRLQPRQRDAGNGDRRSRRRPSRSGDSRASAGSTIPRPSTAGAACLAFSPDGATLAVGQQDGLITLWQRRRAAGKNRSWAGHD